MTTIIEDKRHAELGPSGAERWGNCPGSVAMERSFPRSTSKYAAWGTVAHEVAEKCLVPYAAGGEALDAETFVGQKFEADGFTFKFDMEFADCVNTYVSYVQTYVDVAAGDKMFVEQAVPLQHITGEEDAEGTSDVIAVTKGGKRLVIIDLKGGKGKAVSAKGNPQFRFYGAGALHKFRMIYDEIEEVQCVVIQPRLFINEDEIISVAELKEWTDEWSVKAARTHLPDAERVPGDWCGFCKAKGICEDYRAAALSAVTGGTPSNPSAFPSRDDDRTLSKQLSSAIAIPGNMQALAEASRALTLVKGWVKGVEEEVVRCLMAGIEVPGHKLVQGPQGNRAWADDDDALAELTKSGRLKVDDATTKKVISPTQAEKLLKPRPKIWSKIAPLIVRPEGGPIVSKEGDKNWEKPAYLLASAPESFPVREEQATISPPVEEPATERRWSILD